MRCLKRNKQTVYYANYSSKAEVLDANGKKTGQYLITYGTPVMADWNVSFVDSDTEVEAFGIMAKDTLRIVAESAGFPLTETSILWYGKTPDSPYDATTPKHNYAVAGIRPSINSVTFYAVKV